MGTGAIHWQSRIVRIIVSYPCLDELIEHLPSKGFPCVWCVSLPIVIVVKGHYSLVTPRLCRVALDQESPSLMLQSANKVSAAISLYWAGGNPIALSISCASV